MVDSIFLKSPRRIEALMMVMTLCLMIYNVAQYRLRQTLKGGNETLPNQLKKPIQNPTLRWIFQMMEGIGVVQFFKKSISQPVKELISNLNDLRKKIIRLFGLTACQIYAIYYYIFYLTLPGYSSKAFPRQSIALFKASVLSTYAKRISFPPNPGVP